MDNFIATCEQPGNKYDLQWIHDRRDEPLRDYIRRFSDMRLKIPKITVDEAISAFITGLRFHDDLKDELLRKRPGSVTELLAMAKKYADADDAKKLINEETGRAPRSDHPPRCDDYRDDRGRNDNYDHRDQRNDNRDCHDNRDQRRNRRDDYKGKRPREDDEQVNTVKKGGGRRNYEDDYAKVLKGPCQVHPKSNHTMENCRVLKAIYTRKQAQDDAGKPNEVEKQRNHEDDDDEQERDPRHQYVKSTDHVHSIFVGKVSVESKHERKLLTRACMNVTNADNLITDPRLPAWSHQEISFNRRGRWVAIPELGHFPLVLDPCINSVWFNRVLIDSGSSIDILFRNSLSALKLTQADLRPYEAQFWGMLPGQSSTPLGQITLPV
ncbi:uncharacterized protein [Miscanthus floridulus]|uniref:uncharacterized protein n=1 Tax=Miscanthus floridulus TaxID=154761 RepID=UPI003459C563